MYMYVQETAKRCRYITTLTSVQPQIINLYTRTGSPVHWQIHPTAGNMGCGSSKATAVVPQTVAEAWALPQHEGKKSARPVSRESVVSVSSHSARNDQHEKSTLVQRQRVVKREGKNATTEKETGCPKITVVQEASEDTRRAVHIEDEESIRIQNSRTNSASSKVSDQTADSGLGDEDRAQIITEKSAADLQEVANVPDSLKSPDLTIDGMKLATLIDPFDHRQKMASQRQNMQSKQMPSISKQVKFATKIPDGPNIIKRPPGIAFDILLEDSTSEGRIKRAPTALTRLKKKQREVTKEELDEKQKRAQQRREVSMQRLRY